MEPRYTLTSPKGAVYHLGTSAGDPGDFGLLDSTEGFGLADRDVTIAASAGDGGRVRSVRTPSRSGVISLLVWGSSGEELRTNLRRLASAVRYRKGYPLPTLSAAFPTGEVYSIPFLYESGVDTGARASDTIEAPLNVIYPDPYWTAKDALPLQFSGLIGTAGLLPNLAALPLSPSAASGAQTIINPGDVPADVSWRLQGPIDLVTAVSSSGETWSLGPIAEGEVVTIDTATRRATLANGVSVYDRFDSAPRLFRLQPGEDELTVSLSNPGSNARVAGYFRPRLEVIA